MLRAEPEKAGRPFFFISTECATRVVLQPDLGQKFIIGNPSMEKFELKLHHPCTPGYI